MDSGHAVELVTQRARQALRCDPSLPVGPLVGRLWRAVERVVAESGGALERVPVSRVLVALDRVVLDALGDLR